MEMRDNIKDMLIKAIVHTEELQSKEDITQKVNAHIGGFRI